jgi:hypothetical protein
VPGADVVAVDQDLVAALLVKDPTALNGRDGTRVVVNPFRRQWGALVAVVVEPATETGMVEAGDEDGPRSDADASADPASRTTMAVITVLRGTHLPQRAGRHTKTCGVPS